MRHARIPSPANARPLHAVGFAVLLACGALPASAAPEQIRVLALFQDKAMLAIDGTQRMLRAGQTSPEGVTLIEADSERAVLEVDGERGEYRLGKHISSRYNPPREQPTLRLLPTGSGMYTAVGSINGFPVGFLVDTGATLVAMSAPQARRLGIDYKVEGEPGYSTTASGVVRTYYVRLKKVKVGEIELTNVPAAVIDSDFPSDVLLGNSFLNRLEMRRDGQALELRKQY